MRDFGKALAALAIIALVAFVFWAHAAGPCGWYKYAKTSEVPARCLSHFNK